VCSFVQVTYLKNTLHWMKLEFSSLDLDQETEHLCVQWHRILSGLPSPEVHHTWGDSFPEITVESPPFSRKMGQETGKPDFQRWVVVLEANPDYSVWIYI